MSKLYPAIVEDSHALEIEELAGMIIEICIAKQRRGQSRFDIPVMSWSINDVLWVMKTVLDYKVDSRPAFDVVFRFEDDVLSITQWHTAEYPTPDANPTAMKKRRVEEEIDTSGYTTKMLSSSSGRMV